MSKYIVYCLDISCHNLDIISIEDKDEDAKTIQNNHSFTLLCDLNKNQSLYKLEVKHNIIQIIEVNISINNGWLSNNITENKKPIYEIGIITYCKFGLNSQDIKDSYIPSNKNSEKKQEPMSSNKNSEKKQEPIPVPKPPPQIFQTKSEKNETKNVKKGGLSSVLEELKNKHKQMNLG